MKVKDAIKMLYDNDPEEHIVFEYWLAEDLDFEEDMEEELGRKPTQEEVDDFVEYLDDLDTFQTDLIPEYLLEWIKERK